MKHITMIALAALALTACGPAWHLKKAKEHILKAEAKGAQVKKDTIWKEIITERTVSDTVLQFVGCEQLIRDTLTIETVRWRTKTKIDTVRRILFQQVECKPDTVLVPVEVETRVKAGHTTGQLLGFGLVLLVVGALVGRIVLR